jgi:hypothetical protein
MSNSAETLVQLLHGMILRELSDGVARGASLPLNPHRRHLYFERLSTLGQNVRDLAGAAVLIATRPSAGEAQADV